MTDDERREVEEMIKAALRQERKTIAEYLTNLAAAERQLAGELPEPTAKAILAGIASVLQGIGEFLERQSTVDALHTFVTPKDNE